ncbi:MAG: polysaccharide biosynthesis tyrosine autokinase [Acidobacteria bacterium]|nr:polysaccharide biosynthesis tyrosine autokinase [Acidobacteriota bacterium]
MEQQRRQEFDVREYWRILVRRRFLLLSAVITTTAFAAITSFLATPIYRSTCTISIERTGVRMLRQDLSSSEPSWLDYQNFYNTQYRILTSDAVLRRAVEKLELDKRSAVAGDGLAQAISSFLRGGDDAPPPQEVPPERRLQAHIKQLRGALSIEPVRDSHLVEISFSSPKPAFAAAAANAVARAYMDFTLSAKVELANQSTDFFIDRAKKMEDEIDKADHELQRYMRAHNITTGDSNEVALQNLTDLRNRYTSARAEAALKRARYEVLAQSPAAALEEVRKNGLVESLRRDLAQLERDYIEQQNRFGSEYPEVVQLKIRLNAAREKLEAETARLARQSIDAVQSEYLQAQRQADELGKLFGDAETRVGTLQKDIVEYMALKADLDRKVATYQELMEKQNQVNLSAGFQDAAHNVRIIDEAVVPEFPARPNKKVNVLLGFLFGLFLGLGGAVLAEYIDNTMKTPEDIRETLGAAVLGIIPEREAAPAARSRRGRSRGGRGAPLPATAEIVVAELPQSPTAESYRELRTSLLLAKSGNPPRDLMLTSCLPGEGKTTTTINLAVALAQLGRRVLVVDTDLRRPRCHHVLGNSSARGVSTYLSGMDALDDLVQATRLDRVFLLPAGPVPPNPAELLDAERFHQLVRELRERREFDHVLFDSPPLLSVVDPLLIGRAVDGAVLVVRSGVTSRDSGRLGVEKLSAGMVKLLGVALNAIQSEHVPYHYRAYRYGYSSQGKREREPGGGAAGPRPVEVEPPQAKVGR